MITRLSEEPSATIFRVKKRTSTFLFRKVLFHHVVCNFCMMPVLFLSFIMAALICVCFVGADWGLSYVMMFRN